ncbi:PQQ-binding-like beta-propeller repeat protein [Steroidobacter flavus]
MVNAPVPKPESRSMRTALVRTLYACLVMLTAQTTSLARAHDRNFRAIDDSRSAEWVAVGGDISNARYSPLSEINETNVAHLRAAWTSTKFDEGGSSNVTPIVKGSTMYVTAGRTVYALNAKNGKKIWSYRTVPEVSSAGLPEAARPHELSLLSTTGIPNRRGVAVGSGLVFVGLQDGRVIAINEETGQHVWTQQTGMDRSKKQQVVFAAPTYANGVVFTGLSNGDARLRGRLTAMEAATGKKLWQLFTVPSPGEAGHETWPAHNDAWNFGGGGIWTNAAVDPDLGTVYVATGNAVPPFAGDWRPGDNLYTCSVLAVDVVTGRVKWHYQLVHHDVFDADAGTPVVLYEAHLNGQTYKALAVLRADGYLFQLDRRTGRPLLPVTERPVPQLESQRSSPTQPFPVEAESVVMSCDEWKQHGIPAGFVLGCMWTPPASPKDPQNVLAPFPSVRVSSMAYSPITGYFYAQSSSFLAWPRRAPDPYYFDFNRNVPDLKNYATLAAIDSRSGKLAWKHRVVAKNDGLPFLRSSLLATAGGLIFRNSADGAVEARDASTGETLWRFQTGMTGDSGSPMTYEIDGKQYVSLPMGAAVWTFTLDGTIQPVVAPAIKRDDGRFAGPIIDTTVIDTTSLKESLLGPGRRYFVDEYSFNPYRARVKAGIEVLFVNNGTSPHEVVAVDGSWGSGPLSPSQESWVSFSKPGRYAYLCKNHPWVYGEITVTEDRER